MTAPSQHDSLADPPADSPAARPSFDVDRARRDTPGTREVTHLNNAGAALAPAVVLETMVGHLQLEAQVGGYEAAAAVGAASEAVYGSVAQLIGAAPHEIALAESATRAWDMAFYAFGLGPDDVVVTGESEYSSNVLAFLHRARRTGATVRLVPNDQAGQIDVAALERTLDELGDRAALVSLTHVPTSNGLVSPAAAVGEVTRRAGVPFLLDACQSVGQLAVDVTTIGCDLLSATGRKYLRAPRGTGFLYVSDRIRDRLDPPFIDLHAAEWVTEDRYTLRDDARRFESWEAGVAARLGLGAAVDYALGWGIDAIEARVGALAARLREQLATVTGVVVRDTGERRCGIVTFDVAGRDADDVVAQLRRTRVNTSVARAASARLDLARRGVGDVVRASVHYYNTDAELDLLISLLSDLVAGRAG
ncbi:MAG: hypothetical protein QOC98_701 [Frankiaceae bacterium]|nr:hypothetical protein [Frankiaceae bacterium]